MAKNLEKMSLEELKAHRKEVDAAIADFEKRRKQEALIAAQKAAQEFGFSLEDVMGAKGAKTKTKGVPKYANPDDGSQTWTGRGRQPQWIKDALAAGKSLDDLAI
ncbi:histone-like nucleoid-structuring protein H-NS [Roseibacterium elongatum DSM 19469]|uniref:Histone-like nucleoid-structuring protein H-NS n=1 Tax=Roseicyclus elongatus DSM 19469 TaxID=1294273 RepID=W8S1N5_9RHOB|nr:H-NS histone family protein [Roseibacterium elongatum]AHM04082.1 histone-like nucleoid-structuring protein H-NS [Roseibacterium elongatum DSM 19469]